MKKVIRTICYFEKNPSEKTKIRLDNLSEKLINAGFEIQTKRICSPKINFSEFEKLINNKSIFLSVGTLDLINLIKNMDDFYNTKNVAFNIDLTNKLINNEIANILFEIIKNKPEHTFRFAFTFNNPDSSPYFPSAKYSKNGFSIGLQPTDLSENCKTLEEWFINMKKGWNEVFEIFKDEKDFLGIDSSIAPLFLGKSSLINFVKKLGYSFENSATSDIYIKMTNFIKNNNPKPIGLCGLMLPCLEDFELAEEYEKGNFPIERNIYLSLQSGLGIDCYPIGIDENKKRVLEIFQLIQKLSNKYKKPLSARFVSDGKAKIDQKTNFQNQYLKDVLVRKL